MSIFGEVGRGLHKGTRYEMKRHNSGIHVLMPHSKRWTHMTAPEELLSGFIADECVINMLELTTIRELWLISLVRWMAWHSSSRNNFSSELYEEKI